MLLQNFTLPKLNYFSSSELIDEADANTWKSLHFFNLYRIILSGLFVASIFVEKHLSILGAYDPISFAIVSYIYLSIAILASFTIHWRWPNFETNVSLLTMIDIGALSIIMHASGGIESGLGMLIVVAIAGNSLLTNGKAASLFAAIAVLAILTGQVVAHISQTMEPNYTQAGFLGAAVFATALLSHVLSKKLRDIEQLAEQRGIDLANMAKLNEHVIKRLQSGVIVVDKDNRIRLMNQSAWHMLGLPVLEDPKHKSLASLSDELNTILDVWKNNPHSDPSLFKSNGSSVDVLPSFTQFGSDQNKATLIFLEDTVRMTQHAQQMKLASLGRLTASIAHEIRNPLGAISHADQLLAESPNLDDNQLRLTEIIHSHTKRVNGIIENVLQLSRRDDTISERVNLCDWLEEFIEDFSLSENIDPINLSHYCSAGELTVEFDPTQLQQIAWNLCHNGLRFSSGYSNYPKVELIAGRLQESNRVYLDVLDHGAGIELNIIDQIFEPFFTTDTKGTGLGLYIARELCELNRANIRYIDSTQGGCCFRIEFSGQLDEN